MPPTRRMNQTTRLATYGRGRTVRLPGFDYATDQPVHLTVCALDGSPFAAEPVATMVCAALERSAELVGHGLHGYCLMPDHLHVLISPGDSERSIAEFLRRFKSFTTQQYQRLSGARRLWQTTAYDRVLRKSDDVMAMAAYIANNPVRAGLVECWTDWPYSKVLVE